MSGYILRINWVDGDSSEARYSTEEEAKTAKALAQITELMIKAAGEAGLVQGYEIKEA